MDENNKPQSDFDLDAALAEKISAGTAGRKPSACHE